MSADPTGSAPSGRSRARCPARWIRRTGGAAYDAMRLARIQIIKHEAAMDDDRKSVGKIEGERSKPWQLWRVNPVDGSQIELVAEADTRNELRRLSKEKRRLDSYKTYRNGQPSRS
jgi:hypothetical protein